MRCRHTAPFTPEDVQALSKFFHDYGGKLLIDLTGTSGDECARNIRQFRPMMPIAAIFGADLPPDTLDISESYYTHPVRWFPSEDDALAWLREQ
jgi:hypothetical protein